MQHGGDAEDMAPDGGELPARIAPHSVSPGYVHVQQLSTKLYFPRSLYRDARRPADQERARAP